MSSNNAISKSLKRSDGSEISNGSKKRKIVPNPMKNPHQFFPNGPKVMLPIRKGHTPGKLEKLYIGHNLATSREVLQLFAEIALSSFNTDSLSKQGPEYELVKVLDCRPLPKVQYYHCNFTARQKNETEAEEMLFFGEVKYDKDSDRGTQFFRHFCCHFCCILGPVASETGRFEGKSCCEGDTCIAFRCEGFSGTVHHPEGGYTSLRFEGRSPKLTIV